MMSLDECMQARKMRAHLFYLGMDDWSKSDQKEIADDQCDQIKIAKCL